VLNEPIDAVAHLQLGRAYFLFGDTKEQAAYQDLFVPLERRRPQHPHPERSQSGVREAAVATSELIDLPSHTP
jgi:hypothetical protein